MPKRSILMISFNFPPYAMPGAVRTGALAKHWAEQGWDVHIISVKDSQSEGLHRSIEHENIHTQFINFDLRNKKQANKSFSAAKNQNSNATKIARTSTSPVSAFRRSLWALRAIPDRFHPKCTKLVVEQAIKLAKEIKPAFIYSSAPPNSAHIAAAKVKAATNLPWICEQRDLWIDNPYNDINFINRIVSNKIGESTLKNADAFVCVTDYAAQMTKETFSAPVTLAYNGFDPQDFEALQEEQQPYDAERLTIIHAGIVYAERRDPSALFAAIALLSPEEAAQIRVIFFHDEFTYASQLAEKYGIMDSVEFRNLAPREEILELERAVDILLLCRWNDPRDDGIIPGKVFEYIGARRTILAIGSESGEASDIIRKGKFGYISNDSKNIAVQLRLWLDAKKKAGGRLPDLPKVSIQDYERSKQFIKLDNCIEDILQHKKNNKIEATNKMMSSTDKVIESRAITGD